MTRTWRLASVVVGLALVGLAWLVVSLEPSEEIRQAPFLVSGEIGEQLTGRNLEGTVLAVQLAGEVVDGSSYDPWRGVTEGTWVVVDLSVQNRVEPTGLYGLLTIDGVEYEASSRADGAALTGLQLVPGIPLTGAVLFEVPARVAATATDARIEIRSRLDARLDSSLAVTVDLSSLTTVPELELPAPVRGTR